MKLFSSVWNFIFERSFNMFDMILFGVICQTPWRWNDWQFWVAIIIGGFISQTAQLFNKRLQSRT